LVFTSPDWIISQQADQQVLLFKIGVQCHNGFKIKYGSRVQKRGAAMAVKRKLIVVSFDGLSTLDFDKITRMPSFSRLIPKSAWCRKVKSVYPSLTYPAHASIVTGRWPYEHGIVNNTLIQPERRNPDWFWSRSHIKGDTLFDAAKREGYKTAALMWPVTAGAEIDYNMPEVLANRPWENQILVSLKAGSARYQFEMYKRYGKLMHGVHQPELDQFVHKSLMATLEEKKPDLVLVHYTDLDSQRHHYGFYSKQAEDALKRHDRRLGDILDWMDRQPEEERPAISVFGDHSSLDVERVVNLNPLFIERGLIRLDAHNRCVDYRALMKSADGSAYLYVKGPELDHVKAHVRKIVEDFAREEDTIEMILEARDIQKSGGDTEAYLMLEAARGCYFNDSLESRDPVVDITDKNVWNKPFYHWNTHGFSPLKSEYDTVWMMSGEDIVPGEIIQTVTLVEEGPTYARWLGIELKGATGKPLNLSQPR
jgi:predicted AlkP superfamily pyrophosphatase or phosphodiesterase